MSEPTKEELDQMKQDALESLQVAITKLHNYACACEVGNERTRAFEIYQNARVAARVPISANLM